MIIVIADTSGLLAPSLRPPEHVAANEAITAAGLLVMSPLDHVAMRELGRGGRPQ
ncbi:hypothetical protein GCM10010317_104230 [Streptomyces mirabilis]|nr:hypothetical protein GCM10010317_104230 [Streptomyces mirabilis]